MGCTWRTESNFRCADGNEVFHELGIGYTWESSRNISSSFRYIHSCAAKYCALIVSFEDGVDIPLSFKFFAGILGTSPSSSSLSLAPSYYREAIEDVVIMTVNEVDTNANMS